MARPIKKGIDYFPLDVGFLSDIKTRKVMRACGSNSIAILISLLANIYRDEGYFLKWDDDIAFLVSDEVGVSEGSVEEVVKKSVQVGFFEKSLFDQESILTSKGIQERYKAAAYQKKNSSLCDEYSLLHDKPTARGVSNDGNGVNHAESTQRKGKERKGKKRKVNNTAVSEQQLSFDEFNVFSFVEQNFNRVLSPIEMETLGFWLKEYDIELIKEAVKRTVLKNKYSIGYAEGILRNWDKNNVVSIAMVQEQDEKWATNATKNQRFQSKNKETLPDWATQEDNLTKETPVSSEEREAFKQQLADLRNQNKPASEVANE